MVEQRSEEITPIEMESDKSENENRGNTKSTLAKEVKIPQIMKHRLGEIEKK